MSRFRSFLRKVAKPAVMAFVAGGVAVSLVVSTPSNAHALLIPPVAPPILAGATEMALPELIPAASILGPVGWGIAGVTVVGIGLYATKDYWLPIVEGAFGQANKDAPPSGDGSQYARTISGLVMSKGLTSVAATSTSGPGVTGSIAAVPNTTTTSYAVFEYIQCKKATDGSTYFKSFTYSGVLVNGPVSVGTLRCTAVADQIQAGAFGAPCAFVYGAMTPCTSVSGTPGPVNVETYGLWGGQSFDPKSAGTSYSVSVECIRPDGSKFNLTATSTGDQGALAMPSCDAASPGSHGTGAMSVTGTPPASSGNPATTLLTRTAPTPTTDKPLCGPTIPGQGCKLQVLVDSAPCVMGSWDCAHWLDIFNNSNTSARVSCQYGPYVVPVTTCNPLERAYEDGGAPATDANTDGNTSTRSDTDPNGNQVPRTDPSAGTGTSTGIDTSTMPGAAGQPSSSDADAQQCFPGGWAMLNPMWIVDGIRCSFVPKTDIKARMADLQSTAQTKAPLTWLSPNFTGPGGGGCPNWVMTVGGSFAENVVCGQGFTNAILGVRVPLFGLVSAAMVWPLLRSLWYSVIPILRVAPSSGGKD